MKYDEHARTLPKNKTVKLIKGISGVFHTPTIIEGKTSSSGKTIKVTIERGSSERTYRLDTEEILSGGLEVRDATTFQLYTKAEMRTQQRSNKQPGPRAGTDRVSDADELPEPTHQPWTDENLVTPDTEVMA